MSKFNVVGSSGIESTVKHAIGPVQRPAVKAWLANVLPGKIKRSEHLLERIRTDSQLVESLGPKPPKALVAKMRDLHGQGVVLHRHVSYSPAATRFQAEIREVVDWLDSIPEHSRHFRRMNRMSYDDALVMAQAWHEKLLALSNEADDPDVVEEIDVVETLPDGSRILELKGPIALLREGKLMGHCVGGAGYVTAVSKQSSRIYSLRDPDNRPHVTVEVRRAGRDRLEAVQIKGKGNRPPVERWAALIRPFIARNDMIVGLDGQAIGMLTIGRRTFENPNDLIEHLVADRAETRHHASLGAILPGPALPMIVMRRSDIDTDHRRTLLRMIGERTTPVASTEEVLIALPDGNRLSRFTHVVPTAIIEALSRDLLSGIEDDAGHFIGEQVDALLSSIGKAPGHVHVIEFAGSMNGKKTLLDQMAAFSGRLPALAATRSSVHAARRSNHADLTSRLRRLTAPSGHNRSQVQDRSWAHEAHRLRQMSDDAIEQNRADYAAGAII